MIPLKEHTPKGRVILRSTFPETGVLAHVCYRMYSLFKCKTKVQSLVFCVMVGRSLLVHLVLFTSSSLYGLLLLLWYHHIFSCLLHVNM